jgi:hypothetical protein
VETFGTVLIIVGIIIALAVGFLIAIGVIPLDGYIETYQDKKARERRERERRSRSALGQPTGGASTSSGDLPQR